MSNIEAGPIGCRPVSRVALAAVVALGICVLASQVTCPDARADGVVAITLTPDGQNFADAIGLDVNALRDELQTRLDEAYDILRLPNFVEAFSDAASFSNRGIGVDYAANTKGFIVGIAGNVAVGVSDTIENERTDQPAGGVAPNLSVMVGANLAKLANAPKWTVFLNGFQRSGSFDKLDASLTSVGAHVQYKMLRDRDRRKANLVFLWGGIDITSGVEYSSSTLEIKDKLDTNLELDTGTGAGTVPVTFSATGRYRMRASALTIPIEATTNVRIFYLLSLYGGVGFDIQLGSSDLTADLNGTLVGTNPQDQSQQTIGNASVTIDENQGPSAARARFLAGMQINLWRIKAFLQLNAMPARAASLAFGVRVDL